MSSSHGGHLLIQYPLVTLTTKCNMVRPLFCENGWCTCELAPRHTDIKVYIYKFSQTTLKGISRDGLTHLLCLLLGAHVHPFAFVL